MRAFLGEYDTFIEYGRARSESVLERSESASTIFSARECGSTAGIGRKYMRWCGFRAVSVSK